MLWLGALAAMGAATFSASLAGYVAVLALVELVKAALWIMIGAIFVQAILSWVAPDGPLAGVLNALTFRVLAPIRRVLPPLGGTLDLSPLIAIVLGQLVLMLPVAWLEQASRRSSVRCRASALGLRQRVGQPHIVGDRERLAARAGRDAFALQFDVRREALERVAQRLAPLTEGGRDECREKRLRRQGAAARIPSGTSRATADSTFGAGRNAPAGTTNRRSTAKRACSITVRRPYSAVPGAAAMRCTTSFCSITVMSRTIASYCAR